MAFSLRKLFKYLFFTIATLIMLIAITVGLIPSALQWGINSWFKQQNLNSHIETIELQLFDGRLAIQGLEVSAGSQQKLALGSLVIHFDPKQLFKQKIILHQIKLQGLNVSLEQKQDTTLSIAGVPLPASTQTSATTTLKTRSTWQFEIRNIDLSRLNGCYKTDSEKQQEFCASLRRLKWNGQLGLALHQDSDALLSSLQADMSLHLQQFKLKEMERNNTLASFNKIALHHIDLRGFNTIRIEAIDVEGLTALQRPSPNADKTLKHILTSELIHASDISILNQNNVTLANLETHSLEFVLQRDADNKLEVLKLLKNYRQAPIAASGPATPVDTTAKPLSFKLAQASILDNSSFLFIDKAVQPALLLDLNNVQLSLQKIDNEKKQARSPLKINLRVGQQGQLDLQGNIMLFAERPTLKLDGQLKNINVSDFNAYAEKALQHYVKSGQLDAETSISIEQGQLDSSTKLTLHKFYVEPVTEEGALEYKEQLGLPLGTALSLLREKDDSIKLKLPVTGDVNSPDFSINDVIGKVSTKAVKAAVINYYSPLGIFSVAESLFDLATALRFEPIKFAVGKTTLNDESQQQLDKLALILQERPQLHMVVCGVSTQADRLAWFADEFETSTDEEGETISVLPALDKQQNLRLNMLAVKRGEVVKEYLLKNKQIESSRLILCSPRHKPGDTEPPRVMIQL